MTVQLVRGFRRQKLGRSGQAMVPVIIGQGVPKTFESLFNELRDLLQARQGPWKLQDLVLLIGVIYLLGVAWPSWPC